MNNLDSSTSGRLMGKSVPGGMIADDLPLETHSAATTTDVVGGKAAVLQEIGEVERLALYDEAALEIVALSEAGFLRAENLKLQVAEIAHAAYAARLPE